MICEMKRHRRRPRSLPLRREHVRFIRRRELGMSSATLHTRRPPRSCNARSLLGAETNLRRRGLYRGPVDGAFGPELESALRAYQSRIGLVATGRLDIDTLASLGLLPGQRPPHLSHRRFLPGETVRGEWVR